MTEQDMPKRRSSGICFDQERKDWLKYHEVGSSDQESVRLLKVADGVIDQLRDKEGETGFREIQRLDGVILKQAQQLREKDKEIEILLPKATSKNYQTTHQPRPGASSSVDELTEATALEPASPMIRINDLAYEQHLFNKSVNLETDDLGNRLDDLEHMASDGAYFTKFSMDDWNHLEERLKKHDGKFEGIIKDYTELNARLDHHGRHIRKLDTKLIDWQKRVRDIEDILAHLPPCLLEK